MGDEEIIERLVQVRGVGRWTVEMLLMFRLGRADVLPVSDLGIRKGFARHLRQPPSAGGHHHRAPRRALAPLPLGRVLVPLARARAVTWRER